MSRHRTWCFTINNPTLQDRFAVDMLMKKAKYGIIGDEVGEKGTPHVQGYIHLENPLSLKKIKDYLSRAHLSVAGGSDEDNFKYCSKDGKYKEWGQKSEGQGKRNDIKEVADLIKANEITLEEVMFDYPEVYVKYSRSFEKMFNAVQPSRTAAPEVHWRWGLAGTGKTYYVFEKYGADNIYVKDGTPWWDGYNQQQVILIDDFDNNIPFRTFLRILHEYKERGQVKGGYVNINSPYIYITCEFPPEHFWSGNTLAQVMRRLTSVQEIK